MQEKSDPPEGLRLTRDFAIGLLSSVVATALLALFAKLSLSWSLVAGLAIMVVIQIFWLVKRERRSILDPIVGGSRHVGLVGIHTSDPITTETAVARANHSFFFWGISGKRTASTPSIRHAMIRIARSGGEVRFLIMDPDSDHLTERAKLEGEPVEAWRADIRATLARLKELASHESVLIQVRVFDEPPIWRMIILDKLLLFVHYFLPGQQGPQSPQLEVIATQSGLAQPLLNAFETAWRRARDDA